MVLIVIKSSSSSGNKECRKEEGEVAAVDTGVYVVGTGVYVSRVRPKDAY